MILIIAPCIYLLLLLRLLLFSIYMEHNRKSSGAIGTVWTDFRHSLENQYSCFFLLDLLSSVSYIYQPVVHNFQPISNREKFPFIVIVRTNRSNEKSGIKGEIINVHAHTQKVSYIIKMYNNKENKILSKYNKQHPTYRFSTRL